MFNRQKEKLHSFLNYLELPNTYRVDYWNFQFDVRANIYQVKLAFNEKRRLIALSYFNTALLQIVDYLNGENVLNVQGPDDSFPPKYVLGSSGRSALSKEGKFGYLDLFVTDDYIFGLYSGKTDQWDITANQILQLDWEGKLVRKYILNHDIITFVIDEENNKLYGIDFFR